MFAGKVSNIALGDLVLIPLQFPLVGVQEAIYILAKISEKWEQGYKKETNKLLKASETLL